MQSINSFFTNAQQQISMPFTKSSIKHIKKDLFLASLYGFQDALLFQPNEPDTSRTIVQTPDVFHMPYETITIETPDSEKLHGFLIKQSSRTSERETLVFFHGNAGNIGHRYDETNFKISLSTLIKRRLTLPICVFRPDRFYTDTITSRTVFLSRIYSSIIEYTKQSSFL